MTQEIKPCPFCGSESELIRKGNEHTKSQTAIIRCTKRGCFGEQKVGVITHSYEWATKKVIETWNTRAEPAPPPDDIEIEHLIKQLDMGEPDPSDYEVTKHLFDAQDRHRAAMSAIKVRLLCIKTIRAHIAALKDENKRLRGLAFPETITDEMRLNVWKAQYMAVGGNEQDALSCARVRVSDQRQKKIDEAAFEALKAAISQPVAAHNSPEVSDKEVCGYQVSDKQPEPQKCGTCGGRGWKSNNVDEYTRTGRSSIDCPDCNGTGKAGG